jgi:hypothetical protein
MWCKVGFVVPSKIEKRKEIVPRMDSKAPDQNQKSSELQLRKRPHRCACHGQDQQASPSRPLLPNELLLLT